MASLTTSKDGVRRILVTVDGRRRSIHLGRLEKRQAQTVLSYVARLETAKQVGGQIEGDITIWLSRIVDKLHAKLVRVGLTTEREAAELESFLTNYIAGRVDVKPATRKKYEATKKSLVQFFGSDKQLYDITPGCAEEWRLDMLKNGLQENTARKHIAVAKLFFGTAVKKQLITSNPFSGLKATILPNTERFHFITREDIEKVIKACPNAEWRLIVALSRYGGLRCPSETISLTWKDIDWEHGRIRVRSPKTEHHAGGESRVIPMFPELRPYLDAVWEEAQPGAKYVITQYRDKTQNLRSRLLDIIWAAGLKEWPKLFQNLRSTRETELAEEFPMHVVCKWIGNSQPVAAKHYLQLTDEHFERALQPNSSPVKKTARQTARAAFLLHPKTSYWEEKKPNSTGKRSHKKLCESKDGRGGT